MKDLPWRPVVRLGMMRCQSKLWSGPTCPSQATKFFVWNRGAKALCEHCAEKFARQFFAGFRELSREEWEVCQVQES